MKTYRITYRLTNANGKFWHTELISAPNYAAAFNQLCAQIPTDNPNERPQQLDIIAVQVAQGMYFITLLESAITHKQHIF